MAYDRSVFSSPSYWVALAAGVVGVGAAAMQDRRGSAAIRDLPVRSVAPKTRSCSTMVGKGLSRCQRWAVLREGNVFYCAQHAQQRGISLPEGSSAVEAHSDQTR